MDDDHLAYMAIYERYSRPLYAHACKKMSDRDEVKDLLQDVFTALWQNRYALNPDTPLAGYLHTTLRYRIIKLIAHKKVETAYFESLVTFHVNAATSADDLVREKELVRLIKDEIALLPGKMQKVFRLSRESHLSHREIADQFGLSEATVKKHVNNALKTLRLKLGDLLSLVFFIL
jgi:RNA polymerase sigma-70 factor (ECF subfamily)